MGNDQSPKCVKRLTRICDIADFDSINPNSETFTKSKKNSSRSWGSDGENQTNFG